MKPFVFLALSMSVIFAQTALAVYPDDEDDNADDGEEIDEDYEEPGENAEEEEEAADQEGGEEEEEPKPEEMPEPPTLICALFGTEACNASCLTAGNVYGVVSVGQCHEPHICACSPAENASLDDLWSRKFWPKSALPQIKRNEELSQQVLDILKQSIVSSQETKHELEQVLPKDVFEKIRIKENAPANRIPQPDGQFDQAAVKRLATNTLKPFITAEFPKNVDYKKSLSEALQTAQYEEEIQHLMSEARRTGNQTLAKVIDEFLQANQDIQEQPLEEKPADMTDFVDYHIINELIKATQPKPKPKPQPKATPKPGSTAKKPNPPRPNQSPANPGLSRPLPNLPFPPIQSFTLPDKSISKKTIDGFQRPIDKTWQGTDYQVRFKRMSPQGDTQLWWEKNADRVYLHRHADGSVDQNWNFGGKVMIGLYRDVDQTQIQMWQFGQTRLDVQKGPNSPPYRVWEYNNRDEGSYQKYKQIIESWCQANEFFVGKESCLIL